jgi:hypothetical protein
VLRRVDARQRGGLKIAEISSAIVRTATWLGLVEVKAVALHSEHVKIILNATAIFFAFPAQRRVDKGKSHRRS